jgi:valyl-tRNA synthetase
VNDLLTRDRYDPSLVEEHWYAAWEGARLFAPRPDPNREPPFVITLPPPNVTGELHMGHCLGNSIQDTLIRWMRMSGRETLWVPGTDHASIATEQVVTRQLRAEGLDKRSAGREVFLERAWRWKERTHGKITRQLRRLGCSLDWEREAFTMDATRNRAVTHAFVALQRRGLIYRDVYLVNWCPHDLTAISDDEVEYREVRGHLWYIHYPFADGEGRITVATTRPETMFGDVAVAVHPEDPERNRHIGRQVRLPLTERTIPVIGDQHADPEKGTGYVKITPAHDPNDFEVGRRHELPRVVCMDERGVMNEAAGRFAGLEREAARREVVAALEAAGLLDRVEDHVHQVGHHDRCGTVIEPYVSRQWFLRMEPLAGPALQAVENGTVVLRPERWLGVYRNWLENIRDWCISRQLWWGHRIPVWYCSACGETIVTESEPTTCPSCGAAALEQDPDVLDTWFSSWLWTFSPLGWPNAASSDLKRYHPTSLLVTASDIIFFWVARMIMASYAFLDEPPFGEVLFTGIVRDEQGRKMSKSLGNSPDPIGLIDDYGADALRCSLVMLTPTGQDVFFNESTLEVGRNFCNKIFQATKLVLGHWHDAGLAVAVADAPRGRLDLDAALAADGGWQRNSGGAVGALWRCVFGSELPVPIASERLELADRWVLARACAAAHACNDNLTKRRLNDATYTAFEFFRHEFCDWYLEAIKPRLRRADDREAPLEVAVLVLALSYKILHPVMPYITEELWSALPPARGFLMTSGYPDLRGEEPFPKESRRFARVMEIVQVLRNLRSELGVDPGRRGRGVLRPTAADRAELARDVELIALLAKLETVEVDTADDPPHPAGIGVVGGVEIFLPMAGLVDLERERARIGGELHKVEAWITGCRKKLDNPGFLANAPADVVAKQRELLRENEGRAQSLRERLAALD